VTGPEGLSCYTANLAVYLGPDALDRIARSIRLAVRTDLGDDLLAFSHHRTPVDEGRLAYRGAGDTATALDAIAVEIEHAGGCLVVANTGHLDWSSAGHEGQAPHFLLVDDRRGDEWHVVDRFAALLPSGGGQEPFTGWISTAALARALTPIVPLPPEQRLRNELAFGFPRPLPRDGDYQWLERIDRPEPEAELEGEWLTETDAALELLGEFWAALDRLPERLRLLDDLWAAAQHHVFRYDRLLAAEEHPVLDDARRAWRDLPMALRFAVDSAARGRHRPTLVAGTFDALRRRERDAAGLLEEGEPAWNDRSRTPSGISR
jgi:hypothetical protein